MVSLTIHIPWDVLEVVPDQRLGVQSSCCMIQICCSCLQKNPNKQKKKQSAYSDDWPVTAPPDLTPIITFNPCELSLNHVLEVFTMTVVTPQLLESFKSAEFLEIHRSPSAAELLSHMVSGVSTHTTTPVLIESYLRGLSPVSSSRSSPSEVCERTDSRLFTYRTCPQPAAVMLTRHTSLTHTQSLLARNQKAHWWLVVETLLL